MPQNLDMCSEGKAMISMKLCCLMIYQQVNEMNLNKCGKSNLCKEGNSELCITN